MKIIQPREELRPYVRYYWMLESNEPFSVLTFPIAFRLFSIIRSKLSCPQLIRASTWGSSVLPNSDTVYSTWGGTSGNSRRLIFLCFGPRSRKGMWTELNKERCRRLERLGQIQPQLLCYVTGFNIFLLSQPDICRIRVGCNGRKNTAMAVIEKVNTGLKTER